MRCDDVHALIDLYLDGELDGIDRAEIEGHAAMCTHCGGLLSRQSEFKENLRALAGGERISGEFASRLNASITRAAMARQEPARARAGRSIAAVAAAAAAVFVVVPGAMVLTEEGSTIATAHTEPAFETNSSEQLAVIEDSVRWHSRPLPVEVTGPNPAEVSAWFRGKVDFPVAPPALGPRAHLLGARIGNVRQQEAALLVYDVGGRRMSVMVFSAAGAPIPRSDAGAVFVGEQAGYRVAVREHAGVAYTFTSDLPGQELASLAGRAFHP